MKIAVLRERRAFEARVAVSPETVKKFVGLGFEVVVEKGAGEGASIRDDDFSAAGASVADSAERTASGADLVFLIGLLLVAAWSIYACIDYAGTPTARTTKALETASGVFVLSNYILLGVAPMLAAMFVGPILSQLL